jgi:KUP system potassium uptake protein
VIARFGFMETPNVPSALRQCKVLGLALDLDKATYYIGSETLIPSDKRVGMMLWREHLFAMMARNAARATAYYRLPPTQVVEIGIQVEI